MSKSKPHKSSTLGRRIIDAREAMELSTAQLARRLGVKTATLNSWESNATEPRANRLVTLAAMTGVSLGWLLTGRGEGPAESNLETEITRLKANLATLQAQAEGMAGELADMQRRLALVLDGASNGDGTTGG